MNVGELKQKLEKLQDEDSLFIWSDDVGWTDPLYLYGIEGNLYFTDQHFADLEPL